jgi:hypothetical protein
LPKRSKPTLIPAVEALHASFDEASGGYVPFEDVIYDVQDRLGRLSWGYSSKIPMEQALLVERLAARKDWMIFPDTNAVNIGIDDFWPEILQHPRHVAFTSRVAAELHNFLGRRPDHPVHQALMSASKAVLLRPDAKPGSPGLTAQDYYLALLASRRSVFATLRDAFVFEHGRPPGVDEEAGIRSVMQSGLSRERIVLENKPSSPYLTDEHLVYHSVLYALETGQPTIILSGDFDVAAQFRHLINLIRSHYTAMLFAEKYEQDFAVFRPRTIAPEALRGYFLDRPAVDIDLTSHKGEDPRPSDPPIKVAISCITATPHHVSEMIFNAETQMDQVLRIKGKTGGLSTDRLAGRNFHSWHILPDVPRGHGIAASDIQMPIPHSNAKVAMADLLLSQAGIT